MLKKIVVGAIAAGAISIPLAGAAMADEGTGPGNDNNGPGTTINLPDGFQTPGEFFRTLREGARDQGFQNLPQYLRSPHSHYGTFQSPGQLLQHFKSTPGDDNHGGCVDDADGGHA